jgi:hypothetical protein
LKIHGDIRKSRCTTGVKDTSGKIASGINDTGGKFKTSINDTGGKVCYQFFLLVLLIPVEDFPPVSLIPVVSFATGINNTGSKFASSVNDTGGNGVLQRLLKCANL